MEPLFPPLQQQQTNGLNPLFEGPAFEIVVKKKKINKERKKKEKDAP
jgi:hypothetical protein